MNSLQPGRISLMVPIFNGEKYLPGFLASVEEQDAEDFEIILTDDGSGDNTPEILRAWQERLSDRKRNWTVRIIRQENRGPAMAVQAAFLQVTGEYLTWADSDDLLPPGSVSRRAAFLDAHPETGMVYAPAAFLNGGEPAAPAVGRESRDIFEGLIRGKVTCAAGCYMVRTALLLDAYPDRKIPDSPVGQNLQLLLPAASRTPCACIGGTGMLYRIHPDSRSARARSYTEHVKRLQDLEALLETLIPYCRCDPAEYRRIAAETFREEKKRLLEETARAIRKGEK